MPRPPRRRSRARPSARRARAPQDGSYKHLFSHPEMVEGLLRDFVHEGWLALIGWIILNPGTAHTKTQRTQRRTNHSLRSADHRAGDIFNLHIEWKIFVIFVSLCENCSFKDHPYGRWPGAPQRRSRL